MNARAKLYAQLAFVASNDAAACLHEYAWPPKTPTPKEIDNAAHLEGIADVLFEHAAALGFEGGTDAAFGGS